MTKATMTGLNLFFICVLLLGNNFLQQNCAFLIMLHIYHSQYLQPLRVILSKNMYNENMERSQLPFFFIIKIIISAANPISNS